jgi:hypothetical protein
VKPNKNEQNRRDYLKRKQDGGTITVDERGELKGLQDAGKRRRMVAVANASQAAKMQGANVMARQIDKNTKFRFKEFAERLRAIVGGE